MGVFEKPFSYLLITILFAMGCSDLALALDVTLTLRVKKQKDNRVQIQGKTNLPTGTKLILSVNEKMEYGLRFSSSCFVAEDGKFESTSLGPKSGVETGLYFAEAMMPNAAVQPEKVQLVIGRKGEKVKGPLVKDRSFGQIVSKQIDFSVGNNARQTQASRKKEVEDSIERLKREVCVLLQQLLKFKDETKFKKYGFGVGGPYHQWLRGVDSLRDSTPKGPSRIPLAVRTAPSELIAIGMDLMRKGETEFTRYMLPELKEAIGYADFLHVQSSMIWDKSRVWRGLSGNSSVVAKLVRKTKTHVVLLKSNGKTVQVPIAKLSAADVAYVERLPSPQNK